MTAASCSNCSHAATDHPEAGYCAHREERFIDTLGGPFVTECRCKRLVVAAVPSRPAAASRSRRGQLSVVTAEPNDEPEDETPTEPVDDEEPTEE